MRILCIIDSLGPGGAQRQLVELAIGFKKKGHEVCFLNYHSFLFYKNKLDQSGISVHVIQETKYVMRLYKMRKFIRNGKFDVVLSFLSASSFINEIAGLPFKNWKLIVGERSANPNILKSFKLILYRLFHVFSDFVVTNSYSNLKLIKKINPLINGKLKVIYNITDVTEAKKSNIRYLFKKGGVFNLIIAASHRKLKNLNGLIEAVNILPENERQKIKINWYGEVQDSSLSEGIKKIEDYNLNSVFNFYPPSQEILLKMLQADAVGLFSFYEGLPNALCEGMSLGKPILASAVSDNAYLLGNGAGGVLCNPEDPKCISKGLFKLMNFTEAELLHMGNVNIEKAESLFNKEKIVEEYLSLFTK